MWYLVLSDLLHVCTIYDTFAEINECENSPCVNGTCEDLINNYTCNYIPGYEGRHCHIGMYIYLGTHHAYTHHTMVRGY